MPRYASRVASIIAAIDRARKRKEAFIDAFHAAARVDEGEAEKVRQAYKQGRISYEEAMRRFREIARKGRGRAARKR